MKQSIPVHPGLELTTPPCDLKPSHWDFLADVLVLLSLERRVVGECVQAKPRLLSPAKPRLSDPGWACLPARGACLWDPGLCTSAGQCCELSFLGASLTPAVCNDNLCHMLSLIRLALLGNSDQILNSFLPPWLEAYLLM